MPTHTDIKRERQLLDNLGLLPVKKWPVRCTWYKPDGSIHGTLPCDPYSRLLYMGRGLRPSVGKGLVGRVPTTMPSAITSVPLVDTLVEFMADKTVWDGTATELHMTLENYAVDLPGDATRLSKALSKLASLIEAEGVFLERTRVAQRRGIRMSWAS